MNYLHSLWNYLLISAPYLLLGFFISGIVHVFIDAKKMRAMLGRGRLTDVFKAALLGVPLPLCSCSVIPTAATLRKSGASNGATSAFLISTPETGVDSISLTYGIMDLPMTIIRPVVGFISGFVAGALNHFFNDFKLPASEMTEQKHCCAKGDSAKKKISKVFIFGFGDLVQDLAGWLTIGLILGSMIDHFIPTHFFHELSGLQSRAMILLVGLPLYICASATTPIAAALILKGISPGAALLLLIVGPAVNIANMMVVQKYIGKKGILINISSLCVVGLLVSYIVDYLYLHFFSTENFKLVQHQHEEASLLAASCVWILIGLLMRGLYLEEIKPRLNKHHGHCH